MKLLRKYKHYIIGFGIIFWVFARITGIQQWGSNILWITVILTKIDDVVKYVKENGIVRFSILVSILIFISGLTAIIFIGISDYLILSKIHKVIIMIIGLAIDVLIIVYAMEKLGKRK